MKVSNAEYPLAQSICKQSERMKNIVNTVLNVRRMEVGQSTLHVKDLELDEWEQIIWIMSRWESRLFATE